MADGKQPSQHAVEPGQQPDATDERPIYRKPKLQRHDQIEQVRPYGPSEI